MIFWRKRKEIPLPQNPITTHIIKISNVDGVYIPEILDTRGVNILDVGYQSEKSCRLALVELRNAFQNGTWRVDVIEEKKEIVGAS